MKIKLLLCVLCLCAVAVAQTTDEEVLKSESAKRSLVLLPILLRANGGITTNVSFVSYNGTNYTTNSVTISNGIITGWSQ
jgi:hypothetical protein